METTEATQQGAEEVTKDEGNVDVQPKESGIDLIADDGPSIEPEVKRSRDEVMGDIHARRKEMLQQEMEEAPEATPADPTSEPVDAAEPDDTPAKKPENIAATIAVKIDGEERQVTPQDIINYQKNVAADKRLAEAAEANKRLLAREAELKRREEALAAQPASQPVTTDTEEDLDALADQLIDGTFSEDKSTVKKVLQKLRTVQAPSQPAQPVVTDQELDRRIAARAAALEQAKQRKAMVDKFAETYPELNANVALRNSVDAQTVLERKADPHASDWEIIERSAQHVKAGIKQAFGVVEQPAVNPDIQDRIDRKRAMGTPVVSTAKAKAPLRKVSQGKKLSPFEEIQRARGQG